MDVVQLRGLFRGPHQSGQAQFIIRVRMTNTSTTRKVNYQSWGQRNALLFDQSYAILRDDLGNVYKRVTFDSSPVGAVDGEEAIYPGDSISDVLVFEPPVTKAAYFNLTLPAKNYGEDGFVRLRIPIGMVTRAPTPAEVKAKAAAEAKAAAAAEAEARRREQGEAQRRTEEAQRRAAEAARRQAPLDLAHAKQTVEQGKAAAADSRPQQALELFESATKRCEQIVFVVPKTPVAAEADKLLDEATQLRGKVRLEIQQKAADAAAAKALKEAADKAEAVAVVRLRLAKRLTSEASRPERIARLEELVKEYPQTKAGKEAAELLAELKKPAKAK